MQIVWGLIKAFLVGGALCVVGEALVLKTKLTPARILVGYVVTGVILSAVGIVWALCRLCGRRRHRAPHGLRACAVYRGQARRGRNRDRWARSPAGSPPPPRALRRPSSLAPWRR